jgi:prepilin-type N-terminal cleavage/methylation domain-containing protein
MRSSDSRGFTLLELIVTLFVIMLTIGLAVPVIGRSSEAIRARADVAGFSAVLRHARERAITSRESHAVVIDPAARTMTVLAGDAGEVKQRRTLPERVTVQATPPPALTVRFEPQGTSSGGDYRVTAGDVVYRVTVDPITGRVKNTRL